MGSSLTLRLLAIMKLFIWISCEVMNLKLCLTNFLHGVVVQVIAAMQDAGPRRKPALSNLFTDVYDTVPSNLRKQEVQLRESVTRHPRDYPSDVPL